MPDEVKLLLFILGAIALSYCAYLLFVWTLTRGHNQPERVTNVCANCRPDSGRRPGHVYRSRNVPRRETQDVQIFWLAAGDKMIPVGAECFSTSAK